MDTSVQCLPERILVNYQFQILNFRRIINHLEWMEFNQDY